MATVTEKLIDAWAHCVDGRCPGNKQQVVKGIETLTELSYFDLGGDIPGVERSSTAVRFNDVADAQCEHCGEPRLIADQIRPIYPNVSGIPQDRLLHTNRDTERLHDLQLSDAKRDAEMAQMRELMTRQQATIERQERYLAELLERGNAKPPKRAPSA